MQKQQLKKSKKLLFGSNYCATKDKKKPFEASYFLSLF
jgi:hypothetical protein